MNNRSAQMLTAALGALLVVVVGATIFILLTRPSAPVGPTPSPTGSGLAVATPTFTPSPLLTPSPSASLSPGPTASASASLAPTESPSPSPSPSSSPSPSASVSPSPSASAEPTATPTVPPTIEPTSPQQELVLVDVGLDSRDIEGRVERFVTFTVIGPSLITASTSNASAGGIRLCLFATEDGPDPGEDCSVGRNMTLEAPSTNAGLVQWTATMIGTEANVSPYATLTLRFNALSGRATLDSFRYAGTSANEYNGFDARISNATEGDLAVDASFVGGSFTYQLILGDVGAEPVTGGPSSAVDESVAVSGGQTYQVSIRSLEAQVTNPTPVFIGATISWP